MQQQQVEFEKNNAQQAIFETMENIRSLLNNIDFSVNINKYKVQTLEEIRKKDEFLFYFPLNRDYQIDIDNNKFPNLIGEDRLKYLEKIGGDFPELRKKNEETWLFNVEKEEFSLEKKGEILKIYSKNGLYDTIYEKWMSPSKTMIIETNLSNLIHYKGCLSIIVDLSNRNSLLLRRFVIAIIEKNKKKLKKAILNKINISNADLSNAILFKAKLKKAILNNVNFENARLEYADLVDATLEENTNLSNAIMHNAILLNAKMNNAILKNTDLFEANLINADLTNADLTNANLTNANLTNAILDGANFSDTESETEYDLKSIKLVPKQITMCKSIKEIIGLSTTFLNEVNKLTELKKPELMEWWRKKEIISDK